MVEAVKAREERQKVLPSQLPLPLKEPKLCSFPNKNCASRKMTGTEAAAAAEADYICACRVRACRKSKKNKILERNTKLDWMLFVRILRLRHRGPFLPLSQAQLQDYHSYSYLQEFQVLAHLFMLNLLIQIQVSDLDDTSSHLVPKIPSPTP